MKDATENVAAAHRPIALTTRFGDRNLLIEALMRARRVEELNVVTHDSPKMGLIEDVQARPSVQQFVQAFSPRGSNPAFHEGIGVRGVTGHRWSVQEFIAHPV